MVAAICSMGVMPVPPAIMPSLAQVSCFEPLLKTPRPRYSCMPHGPETVMASPSASAATYCDILPPSTTEAGHRVRAQAQGAA